MADQGKRGRFAAVIGVAGSLLFGVVGPAENVQAAGAQVGVVQGSGKITVRVWRDSNGDGVAQVGEPAASGQPMTIAGGGLWAAKTTSAGGWVGAVVPAGCYTVTYKGASAVTAVPLNLAAKQYDELDDQMSDVSNWAQAQSRAVEVCVKAGETRTKLIGLRPSGTQILSVRLWHDKNANGRMDVGEPGIPNIRLTISDVLVGPFVTSRDFGTKTTTSGGYVGWTIPRGTCGYIKSAPDGSSGSMERSGFSPTISNVGDDVADSDWIGQFAPFCVRDSNVSVAIGLVDIDDAIFDVTAVSGVVWVDQNKDGQRQGSEPLGGDGIRITRDTESKYSRCRGRSAVVSGGKYQMVTGAAVACSGFLWSTLFDVPEVLISTWGTEFTEGGRLSLIARYSYSVPNGTAPHVGDPATDSDFVVYGADVGSPCLDSDANSGAPCAYMDNPPKVIQLDLGLAP